MSSAGARTAPPLLRLPEPAAESAGNVGKEITRSAPAPAEKCPHGDDGWGEFVGSAEPAADQWQGRPKDCTAPSFSSHHEAARRRPRREARAPCGIISRKRKRLQKDDRPEVTRARLDTGRDREADPHAWPQTVVSSGKRRPDSPVEYLTIWSSVRLRGSSTGQVKRPNSTRPLIDFYPWRRAGRTPTRHHSCRGCRRLLAAHQRGRGRHAACAAGNMARNS